MRKHDGTQFIGKFASSKSKHTQAELMTLLMPFRPAFPFIGPLHLSVVWRYPWRSSEPKKNRFTGIRWCDKRPDCDNLCKMLQDNMSRLGFWIDDAQISHLEFRKQWAEVAGIGIEITGMEYAETEAAK